MCNLCVYSRDLGVGRFTEGRLLAERLRLRHDTACHAVARDCEPCDPLSVFAQGDLSQCMAKSPERSKEVRKTVDVSVAAAYPYGRCVGIPSVITRDRA